LTVDSSQLTAPRQSRTPNPESRDRNWRPGGEHRDPRQKFIDAKKDRNQRMRKERWENKSAGDREGFKPRQDQKKPWPRNENKPWQRDERKPWQRDQPRRRAQTDQELPQPKRPPGPNREPKPSENPEPTRPPHPSEPNIPPPGPPEQGRSQRRPFRSQKRFSRGPRRG